jgi:hypothetical protein
MKRSIFAAFALLSLTLFSSLSLASGGRSDGGGDLCEDRIKIIRDDLKAWIQHDGPERLELPNGISTALYSERMLAEMGAAKVRCLGPHDEGYPILVNGAPKVCRFDRSNVGSMINCDLDKFNSLNESDQYVLIHHEFAGLAGVEIPNGDDSHYEVSNQISGYLADKIVKSLVVKAQAIAACRLLNSAQVPVGTKCVTSKGAVFERVSREYFNNAWKGPDGLVWSSMIVDNSTQFGAISICKALNASLPSMEDFVRGNVIGLQEVVTSMQKYNFWSFSIAAEDAEDAYVFHGPDGSFWHLVRGEIGGPAVICIGH